MRKIFNIWVLVAALLFAFSSCVKDLDTKPLTDNILLPETAWQDQDSYEQFVSKIYAGLSLSGNEGPAGQPDITADDQGEATFLRSYWNLQELCTDEVLGAWDNETLRGLQFCQWTSSNNFLLLNYTRIYMNVAYANEFLRETTDSKLEERGVPADLKNQIKTYRAEVRALRALNYYCLMDLYANVPYIPEEAGVGAYLPEQKDRKFFFSFIESELKDAEAALPPNTKANYGKLTSAAAWMILAKLYLNAEVYIGQNKYTECLQYVNKVLAAGYSLDPAYKNMFGADNYKSPEIIFPLVFDGRRATTYGGTTFLLAASYKSDMNPADNFGFSQAWSGIRAKESLSARFANNDKRALFWKEGRTLETTQWYDFNKGWSVIKYTNINGDGQKGSNPVFADTDFPFFRLADAYLMYAEAVLRGGQGGTREQARTLVNALRDRADADDVSDTQFTLSFILDERSRELYWEGHRRSDLIRFGKFTREYSWPWKNGVFTGVPTIDDKYDLYPLPASELTANPKLVQNKGY
ncbi:RagB/SusD family nutrient uptake outer membrane protein [Arcticibacter tournemirensis]